MSDGLPPVDLESAGAFVRASGFVTDQASVAFGDSYRRYTQSLTDAVSALGGMAQYLRTSASALADVNPAS